MKKKVIVQLVDSLNLGGTERMSVNLANTFHQHGFESHLIVSRNSGGLENYLNPAVKICFLNKRSFTDATAFLKLVKQIREIKPDYIHAHSTSIYWAVLLKIFVGSFMLIWHEHFGLSDQLDQYKRSERYLLKWIDRIVVVNYKLLDYWQKKLSSEDKAVAFLPNFPYIEIDASLQKYETFTFINLANYRPQKDQLTLIEAAKILDLAKFDFQILLVGQHVDADWEKLIRNKILELKLESKVKVYGPSDEASDLLVRSHVGVLSSSSEGLPVSLLEYGLASLPTICTKVGECSEVLGDGKFGILVDPGKPDVLANSMKEMLINPDQAFKLGKEFQKHVKQNYGSSQFMKGYQELLLSF